MDPLASAAALAAYTKGLVPADDPRADLMLRGASTGIRRYCGWHIAPVVEVSARTYDGPGGRVFALPTRKIVALTSIVELGTTLVEGTDYEWSEDGEIQRLNGCWPERYRSLVVTFEHGYPLELDDDAAEDDYDDASDIQEVVLAVVSRALSSPTGATREQAGAQAVTWATVAPGVSGGLALLAHEQAIVDTYRIVGA